MCTSLRSAIDWRSRCDSCRTSQRFFRGISITISARLKDEANAADLLRIFEAFYANEPLIAVSSDIPEVRSVANAPGAFGRRLCGRSTRPAAGVTGRLHRQSAEGCGDPGDAEHQPRTGIRRTRRHSAEPTGDAAPIESWRIAV